MINAQSLMIAYLDDYKLMFLITLCAAPLILLLRYRPMQGPAAGHPSLRRRRIDPLKHAIGAENCLSHLLTEPLSPCPPSLPRAKPARSIISATRCPSSRTIPACLSTSRPWPPCGSISPRSSAARRPCHAPLGQEGMAGGVAGQGDPVHRPHDAGRRRHPGPRPPPLRQGQAAAARGAPRRLGLADRPSRSARSASTTASSRPRSRRSPAPAFPSPRCRPAFPAGLAPFERGSPRSASVDAGADEIDIVITREHVLTRQLAGALRRGRGASRRPAATRT